MVDQAMVPISYYPYFVKNADAALEALKKDLAWERRGSTPRSEYYINTLGDIPYVYGKGAGIREYRPRPMHPFVAQLLTEFRSMGHSFEVCFLNRYHNQSDQLGWHADDSPEMDDARPIAIVSLGVEREIWFAPKDDKTQVTRQLLHHGSLCLMAAGMQDTHLHRIPKAGFVCGERISLTFRGYAPLSVQV
jgi:alkylated DNA repair dioxygenase AlkB